MASQSPGLKCHSQARAWAIGMPSAFAPFPLPNLSFLRLLLVRLGRVLVRRAAEWTPWAGTRRRRVQERLAAHVHPQLHIGHSTDGDGREDDAAPQVRLRERATQRRGLSKQEGGEQCAQRCQSPAQRVPGAAALSRTPQLHTHCAHCIRRPSCHQRSRGNVRHRDLPPRPPQCPRPKLGRPSARPSRHCGSAAAARRRRPTTPARPLLPVRLREGMRLAPTPRGWSRYGPARPQPSLRSTTCLQACARHACVCQRVTPRVPFAAPPDT